MAMTAHDEMADELLKRLHDPAAYVDRGPGDRPSRQEPLDMWKLRAVMDYFEDVQKRKYDGKITIMARSAFRDTNPDLDGE